MEFHSVFDLTQKSFINFHRNIPINVLSQHTCYISFLLTCVAFGVLCVILTQYEKSHPLEMWTDSPILPNIVSFSESYLWSWPNFGYESSDSEWKMCLNRFIYKNILKWIFRFFHSIVVCLTFGYFISEKLQKFERICIDVCWDTKMHQLFFTFLYFCWSKDIEEEKEAMEKPLWHQKLRSTMIVFVKTKSKKWKFSTEFHIFQIIWWILFIVLVVSAYTGTNRFQMIDLS